MNASDALERGLPQIEPTRGRYFEESDDGPCRACAVGTLLVGLLGLTAVTERFAKGWASPMLILRLIEPEMVAHSLQVACPVCGRSDTVRWTIEELFEYHRWEIPQIIVWLRSIGR